VREDRIHGSLLVLSELMRCSNADWESTNRELEDLSGSGPPLADTDASQSYFNMSTLKKQYKQLAGTVPYRCLPTDTVLVPTVPTYSIF